MKGIRSQRIVPLSWLRGRVRLGDCVQVKFGSKIVHCKITEIISFAGAATRFKGAESDLPEARREWAISQIFNICVGQTIDEAGR